MVSRFLSIIKVYNNRGHGEENGENANHNQDFYKGIAGVFGVFHDDHSASIHRNRS